MNPTELETNLSKVYGLFDELRTGKLPKEFGTGYDKRVYNRGITQQKLNEKVEELCSLLKKKKDITKYSLEMQVWWRDHQKADKEREKKEAKQKEYDKARKKALAKLTPAEKKLLNLK
jgi:hypothetical protein